MMRKKKMNNKGFSLVELIVVMAIMAILAVTFAPKLMHYVDKAKQTNDREVVNSIYNATRLALMDDTMETAFENIANKYSLTDSTTDSTYYMINLSQNSDSYYTITDTSWVAKSSTNAFMNEIYGVADKFKLKAKAASVSSDIVICYDSVKKVVTVILDYSGISTELATTATTKATTPKNAVDTAEAYITAADYKVTE